MVTIRWFHLLALAVCTGTQPSFGQQLTQDDIRKTDTRIVDFDLDFADPECYVRDTVIYKFKIPRVVVDPSGSNPNGSIANPALAISNGLVSSKAKLKFDVTDSDYSEATKRRFKVPSWGPVTHTVHVNGGPAGSFSSVIGERVASVEVDIGDLRFARPGPPGKDSIAGENTIRIIPTASSFPRDSTGRQMCGDFRTPGFAPVSLEFDALAPVILVHGNGQSGAFFAKHDFSKPLRDRKMVFSAISFDPPGNSIPKNTTQLASFIDKATKQFGAKHFHLVAHSKGGLDSRSLLASIPNGARGEEAKYGVYSLTTMSTPHHGSILADYAATVMNHRLSVGNNSDAATRLNLTRAVLASDWWDGGKSAGGLPSLTLDSVANFNRSNPSRLPSTFLVDKEPNATTYRTISADANPDGTRDSSGPTIQKGEATGTDIPCVFGDCWIATNIYRLLGQVLRIEVAEVLGVAVVREIPGGPFRLNDLAVTVESSRMADLVPAAAELAMRPANHSTVVDSVTASTLVVPAILAAQPMKKSFG